MFDSKSTEVLFAKYNVTRQTLEDAWDGPQKVLVNMTMDALMEVDSAEKSVRTYVKRVTDAMVQTTRYLDEGFAPNSLGVLQNTGLDLDRSVAVLAEKVQAAGRLLYVFTKEA